MYFTLVFSRDFWFHFRLLFLLDRLKVCLGLVLLIRALCACLHKGNVHVSYFGLRAGHTHNRRRDD
jgi:hypothetical protein